VQYQQLKLSRKTTINQKYESRDSWGPRVCLGQGSLVVPVANAKARAVALRSPRDFSFVHEEA